MAHGLKDTTIDLIIRALADIPEIEQAILYGSRAKGNNRKGSDVDIVLKGEKLTLHELNKLSLIPDDLLLPYTFDLTIYHRINNQELVNHINRVGKVLYSREDQ